MAEPGGTTTQLGIRYQNSIGAVFLGRLCAPESYPPKDQPEQVRIEAPAAVDDIYLRYQDSHREWIQAKVALERGTPEWKRVWRAFEAQFWKADFGHGTDRLSLYVGTRTNLAHNLAEACRRAEGHATHGEWLEALNREQAILVSDLCELLDPGHSDDDDVLRFFQSISVEVLPLDDIERDVVPRSMPQSNLAPALLFAILRDLAGGAGSTRKPFFAADLIRQLRVAHGIEIASSPSIESLLNAARSCSDVLRQHRRTIAGTNIHVDRPEVDAIVEWARTADHDKNVGVVLDQAGMGKTVLASDVLNRLEMDGVAVLAIKADVQLTDVRTPDDVRVRLQLSDDLVRTVQRIAMSRRAVVLLDQVDALSLSMARDQGTLDLVLDLLARLRRIPNTSILMCCRTFDLHNDPKLRQIDVSNSFPIAPLTAVDVERVLEGVGVDFRRLSQTTQTLLSIPLHLDIFVRALQGREIEADYHEVASIQDLYRLLWSAIVMRPVPSGPSAAARKEAILLLTDEMYQRQQTTAPLAVFEQSETAHLTDAVVFLASQGVLLRGQNGWSFFHQTFFDYCHAMRFVEGGGDLHSFVLASDQGLLVRPQLVQILSYLRGSDDQEYLRQLILLLGESQLRGHLSDLLLRWFGVLAHPREGEWAEARKLLAKQETRARAIRAMRGNADWFSRLCTSHLPRFLEKDDAFVDAELVQYLASVADVSQPEVMDLLRQYVGKSQQWDARISTILGTMRGKWGQGAVDLYEKVFLRYLQFRNRLLYDMEHVVDADAAAAARLIRAYLDHQIDAHGNAGSEPSSQFGFDRYSGRQGLLNSLGDAGLREPMERLAKEHPTTFIESFMPLFDRLIGVFGGCEPGMYWYASDWLSNGWYNDLPGFQYRLPWLFIEAFRALGRDRPEALIDPIDHLATMPCQSAHQLIVHAYCAAPEFLAQRAFRYLTSDHRRLNLGDDDQFETRKLISAIHPYLSSAERFELEACVLSYAPIWRSWSGPLSGLRRRGLEQLNLLRAFPRESLSGCGEMRLQEWERKFPQYVTATDARTIHGGFVGSPIEHVDRLSDRDWLRAMNVYHGPRDHRRDLQKGGAYQLSGALKERVKCEPDRFYRLALGRVPLDADENYVRAILDGLTEAGAPISSLADVIRRFSPVASWEVKRAITWNLRRRYEDSIPPDILDLLESFVRGPIERFEQEWMTRAGRESKKGGHHDDAYHACINSVRGSALETLVLALGDLGSPESRERQWRILDAVALDPSTPLRAGGIQSLLYVLDQDRGRAASLFEQIVTSDSRLLAIRGAQEFLYYGLSRFGKRMYPFVVQLLEGPTDEEQQHGAELMCLMGMHGDEEANAWLEKLMTGRPAWRRGCALVYSHNVGTARSGLCYEALKRLSNDDDEAVRGSIGYVLRQMDDEAFSSRREFLNDFVSSRSLHSEFHEFTEFLKDKALLDPAWSLAAVTSVLDNKHDPSDREMYRDMESLVRAVVQIYTHVSGPTLREVAMDVFDRLVNERYSTGSAILAEFDRR